MVAAYNKTTSSPISFNINFLASVAPAAYPTKIQSLFSTGKPPDMFMNWGGAYARPLISAGYVKVLNSWYEKYNWTGHKLIPAAVDYITFGGKQYGVPVNLLAMPIWYNKTLFKKAGVSVPKTYAEWGQCKRVAQEGRHHSSRRGRNRRMGLPCDCSRACSR